MNGRYAFPYNVLDGEYLPATIVIVDDHEIVREGVRTLITRSRPGWEIVGEANSGAQAIEMCKTLKPDVLVLDITMPGMSGLEAALRIAELELSCRVLMFTMHESERLGAEVRQAGAQGLVLKSQAARDLIRAIDCLLAGGTFFGTGSAPGQKAPSKVPPSGSATDQSGRLFSASPVVRTRNFCNQASLTMSAVSSAFRAHCSMHSEKSAISLSRECGLPNRRLARNRFQVRNFSPTSASLRSQLRS